MEREGEPGGIWERDSGAAGRAGAKAPGWSRARCVRKACLAGRGRTESVRRGRGGTEGTRGRPAAHPVSSLPTPSSHRLGPACPGRLFSSSAAVPRGGACSWPGSRGRGWQPSLPRSPSSWCRRPHGLPRGPLGTQLPCCSGRLPQKSCSLHRCWTPGPHLLPEPQDTPAGIVTKKGAATPPSARSMHRF